jgi:phosphoribosyl 1,2-cyclic phosphodiesterase
LVGVERRSGGVREALSLQMRSPQFPIGIEMLCGAKAYRNVAPRVPFTVGPFRITTLEQDHPNGVVAWRVETATRSMVFATDVEHGAHLDVGLQRSATGVDLLVHDAQYTAAEYAGVGGPPRQGWGHSTWQQAVELAQLAGGARLALFHHDPTRDDDAVAIIEHAAQQRFAPTFAAREGLTVAF